MISATIKKPSQLILRISVALVFLSAGLFRVFCPQPAQQEIIDLHLPLFMTWPIVTLEITSGILLLWGKYLKTVASVMIFFLILAFARGLMIDGNFIWKNLGELFVFKANPVDMFLHVMFIIVLWSLWAGGEEEKNIKA